MPMRRLNFHITDDQLRRLHLVATERDLSVAELVRRFVDQGLARVGVPSELGESVVLADVQRQLAALEARVEALTP
jgi:hypothetical protein